MSQGVRRSSASTQVERFHHEIIELIKKYQFRDRNQVTSCGISVSQCYVLETLNRFGPQNMNQLAERMHLSVSTLTRVVDQLVAKGHTTRQEGEHDRRFKTIRLTERGRSVAQSAWESVFASEKTILESFPADQRETVIRILQKLNSAADGWRSGCARPTASGAEERQ